MAKPRHLEHAPVTEALVDLRVKSRHGLTFADLQRSFAELDFGYYLKGAITQGAFEFKMTHDGIESRSARVPEQIGLRLHSTDDKYVFQCGIDGFTISRLPPYEDWHRLLEEVRRIWGVYVNRLQPISVTRVATRYINNLRLPLGQGESFQTYLNKFADVPGEAPQAMAAFMQRFQLVDVDKNTNVNLTVALDAKSGAQPFPVILDVDAFAVRQLSPDAVEIWDLLDTLREIKNQCFFGSLTERAMELYE